MIWPLLGIDFAFYLFGTVMCCFRGNATAANTVTASRTEKLYRRRKCPRYNVFIIHVKKTPLTTGVGGKCAGAVNG